MNKQRQYIFQSRYTSFVVVIILMVLGFSSLFAAPHIENDEHDKTATKLSKQPNIILNNEALFYSFANKFSFIEDKTAQLSFLQAKKEFSQGNGIAIDQDNISLGYIKSVIWLKFTVENQTLDKNNWLLVFDYPLLDDITIHYKNTSDQSGLWSEQVFGDQYAFSKRLINHRAFALPFAINNSQVFEFYVRINTESSMQLRPYISSPQNFFSVELGKEIFFGLIYGIMIMMAIYNIFLYFAVKDISYLAYVFSVLTACIFIVALNGHAYQYLWPDNPKLANTIIPLFTSLWMASTAYFTQLFLETKKFAPRLYWALNFAIAFALFTAIFSIFGDYQTAIKIATTLALFNGILILSTSIVCWLRGNRPARFFVVAWTVYGIGMALLVTSRFGLISDNFFTHHSATLGLLVEIIILSLALSDKYRLLNEALAQHTVELESKVMLRTQELKDSNLQLEKLSRHDPLTNLPNRRYFDLQFAQEWERAIRENKPLAILVCDVDEFKSINDHFGHQYGDQCLLEVSSILQSSLNRPADMVARLGGDEFVVLLPDTEAIGAELLGKQICEKIQTSALKQAPDAEHDIVTLSIGCAAISPTANNKREQLFARADKNLFTAKARGRNGVVSA